MGAIRGRDWTRFDTHTLLGRAERVRSTLAGHATAVQASALGSSYDRITATTRAIAWANANQREARNLIQPHLNLPQSVIDALPFPHMRNTTTPESIAWWIDIMKSQGRLRSALKPADMIAR